MTKEHFSILDIAQQEELVEKYGMFIRTDLIQEHLCDIYIYQKFYLVFYYLISEQLPVKSKCFMSMGHIEHFVDVLERFHTQV